MQAVNRRQDPAQPLIVARTVRRIIRRRDVKIRDLGDRQNGAAPP
jgi:hypothetical protein